MRGEFGIGGVDRKQAGVPEGAGLGVAQVKITPSIAHKADAAFRMVQGEGLVVEHAIAAAEVVEPGDESIVPQEVDLCPRGRKGVRDDEFATLWRKVPVRFHAQFLPWDD